MSSIAAGGGPIQIEACLLDRAREGCVLGQEAVAGMNGACARFAGGRQELLDDQVALRGGGAAEGDRLVREPRMQGIAVGVGVDSD